MADCESAARVALPPIDSQELGQIGRIASEPLPSRPELPHAVLAIFAAACASASLMGMTVSTLQAQYSIVPLPC